MRQALKHALLVLGLGVIVGTPGLGFADFWANDDPVKLAQGLKAALSQTNSVKP